MKKDKALFIAPEILLWEKSFDFISQRTLDECSSRLNNATNDNSFLKPYRTIYLSSIEQGKVLFHLSEGRGYFRVWAVGHLETLPNQKTYVYGKVGMSPEIMFLIFFFAITVFALILMGYWGNPSPLQTRGAILLGVFIGALMFAGTIYSINNTRSQLLKYLRETLEV